MLGFVMSFPMGKMMRELLQRKQARSGIGLLEGIIYLSCSMLFITLAGRLVLEVQKNVRLQMAMNERMVELAIALDRLSRIIGAAPAEKRLWKVTEDTCVVFRCPEGDRAIALENGRVLLISGSYNALNRTWEKRAPSVLLEKATLSLAYHYKAGTMQGVTIRLSALSTLSDHKPQTLELFVATKRAGEAL